MNSKNDFDSTISEVVFLNSKSESDEKNSNIYFKVIILLLVAKMEKYVKDSCKEFINKIVSLQLTNKNIPRKLLKCLIENELSFIKNIDVDKYINNDGKNKDRAKIFSLIWNPDYSIEKINDEEFSASVTQHCDNPINNVYSKIGFDSLIGDIEDYKKGPSFSGTQYSYSVKETLNKIINIRNNIVHQDATPNITSSDIKLYINITKYFVEKTDFLLKNFLLEKIKEI